MYMCVATHQYLYYLKHCHHLAHQDFDRVDGGESTGDLVKGLSEVNVNGSSSDLENGNSTSLLRLSLSFFSHTMCMYFVYMHVLLLLCYTGIPSHMLKNK